MRIFLFLTVFFATSLQAFEGFYVGGSTGPSLLEGRNRGSSITLDDAVTITNDTGFDVADYTWDGVGFAGYGVRCNRFYGAVEGFIKYSNHTYKEIRSGQFIFPQGPQNILTQNIYKTVTGRWHYGIDFRPGYFLNSDTVLYGRIGVDWTRQRLFANSVFSDDAESVFLEGARASKKHRAFLRVGAGVETNLCQNVNLRFDYIYTRYRHLTGNVTAANLPDNSVDSNARLNVRDHSLLVGLSYYFSQGNNCCYFNDRFPAQFCGLYVGGSIGASLLDARRYNDTAVVLNFDENIRTNVVDYPKHFTDTAFNGTMLLGYSSVWRNVFAGVEVFGQYSDHLRRTRTDNTSVTTTRVAVFTTDLKIDPWQYGIQFRPGFLITKSALLFGTIGGTHASIVARSEGLYIFVPGIQETIAFRKHRDRFCLRAGGGVEFAFASSCHLRADYIFTDYGKLSFDSTTVLELGEEPIRVLTFEEGRKFHFYTHAVTIGLVKYF